MRFLNTEGFLSDFTELLGSFFAGPLILIFWCLCGLGFVAFLSLLNLVYMASEWFFSNYGYIFFG